MIIGVVIGIIVLAVAAMMTLGSDDDFDSATGCFSQGGRCIELGDSDSCATIDSASQSCESSGQVCCRIGTVESG